MIQIDDPYIYKITISIKSKRGYFLSAAIIDCSDIFLELPQTVKPLLLHPGDFNATAATKLLDHNEI